MLSVGLKKFWYQKRKGILLGKLKHMLQCLTLNIHKTEGRDASLASNDDKAGRTVGKISPSEGMFQIICLLSVL